MVPGDDSGRSNVIPFPGSQDPQAESILNHPSRGRRDGAHRMTLVSVEIRGWEDMVQSMAVERARHLASVAVDAALTTLTEMGGHEVTLEGEPWLPTVSGTLEGPATSVRALQAAIAIRRRVGTAQAPSDPDERFKVGIGVASGEVVDLRTDETGAPLVRALGPIAEVATRLRGFAGHGQIFICAQTFREAGDLIVARELGGIRVNHLGEEAQAYCLTELKAPIPDAER